MGHKNYKLINVWLKDLREKQYAIWIYSTHFLEKTKPAVYYLSINSIRYLKTIDTYPATELRKRYRESSRSESFQKHCVLVADCCTELQMENGQMLRYDPITQAAYLSPEHGYHFLADEASSRPDLCIVRRDYTSERTAASGDVGTITNYLLHIFDLSISHYRLRSMLKRYVTDLVEDSWDSGDNDPLPIVLFVCPRRTNLMYVKRRIGKLLLDAYYDAEDIPKDIHVRYTITARLQLDGVTAMIWQEGRKLYDL